MKWLLLQVFLVGLNGMLLCQDCCEFEVSYLLLGSDLPTPQELQECSQQKDCDAQFYHLAKMIRAYELRQFDSVEIFFQETIHDQAHNTAPDITTLQAAYLFAKYLEIVGNTAYALSYYRFIQGRSSDKHILNLLAKIGQARLSANETNLLKLSDSLDFHLQKVSNLSLEEELVAKTLLAVFLPPFHASELIDNYYQLALTNKESKSLYLIRAQLVRDLYYQNDPRADSLIIYLNQSEYKVGKVTNPHTNAILTKKYLAEKKYEKSLEYATLNLQDRIGSFSTNQEILDLIPNIDLDYLDAAYSYANTLLFQTRIGKGLPPVKEAFSIYNVGFNRQLNDRFHAINLINAERRSVLDPAFINMLVIGTYLYQQTGELSYLNRSASVMDAASDVGGQFWSLARNTMRAKPRFARAIAAEQAAVKALTTVDASTTLAQIGERQQTVEKQRANLREKFPEFYDTLTQGYQFDLAEIQEDLRQEDAGIVAFYVSGLVMYRLFVTADTIGIELSSALQESLKLTTELNQLLQNGKSAEETAASSRQLYALLFAGIEESLPERLHIIAGGELARAPFPALRRDTAGNQARYLGVECAISRQFSIRGWQLLKELDLAPRHPQPFGLAPSFDNNFLAASELRQAGYKLPPLLYNKEELLNLQRQSAGRYLFGEKATLDAYKKNAKDYSILHLATHAISSQTDGLKSHLYLLDEQGEPISLYAANVGDQTLNADLVVLSACETGKGGIHFDEGQIGLTKAYLAAGSRAVVASDWSVDDHATAELMGVFYDSLAVGQTPALALRAARQSYLTKFPDASPYKWAAFNAYGGMVPPRWEKEASWITSFWPWLLAGVVAVLGLLLYQRKSHA